MIDVCLLGTGGMMPLPGRALTSLYVRTGSRALLIDCGEGTQIAMRQAAQRFKPIEAVLITHFHADHISGLPGLLLTLGNEGRTEPLHMYGPLGLERIVSGLRVIVPELPFEIVYHEFGMENEAHFECAGLDADVFPVNHGMACLGYHIELKRTGRFDPEKAKTKGIPVNLWGRLQKGESADGFTPEDVLGAPRKGLKLVYATDTRPVPAIEKYAADADLLILEGMFGEHDKQERARISGHMMMQEAAEIAKKTNAKQLWLTHYSPATPEPELFEEELKEIFSETVICSDGMFARLQFAD